MNAFRDTGLRGSAGRRAVRGGAVLLVTAALVCGAAACNDTDGGSHKSRKSRSAEQSGTSAVTALTAAYHKTAAAKSAHVHMTMKSSGTAAGAGTIDMSGVMGWNPQVMDMTMKGSAFSGVAGGPKSVRLLWTDNVMYMDMGSADTSMTDGKRWMKFDLMAAAKSSGDQKLVDQMTGSLADANQDPAEQLAVLLDSPNVHDVGSDRISGVQAEHYRGKLTVEDLLKNDKSLSVLDPAERKKAVDGMKKAGIKGYDTEVWVNSDDLPVRMTVHMTSKQGAADITADYSDYGAKASVQAPPADQTMDLMKMLKELSQQGGATAKS